MAQERVMISINDVFSFLTPVFSFCLFMAVMLAIGLFVAMDMEPVQGDSPASSIPTQTPVIYNTTNNYALPIQHLQNNVSGYVMQQTFDQPPARVLKYSQEDVDAIKRRFLQAAEAAEATLERAQHLFVRERTKWAAKEHSYLAELEALDAELNRFSRAGGVLGMGNGSELHRLQALLADKEQELVQLRSSLHQNENGLKNAAADRENIIAEAWSVIAGRDAQIQQLVDQLAKSQGGESCRLTKSDKVEDERLRNDAAKAKSLQKLVSERDQKILVLEKDLTEARGLQNAANERDRRISVLENQLAEAAESLKLVKAEKSRLSGELKRAESEKNAAAQQWNADVAAVTAERDSARASLLSASAEMNNLCGELAAIRELNNFLMVQYQGTSGGPIIGGPSWPTEFAVPTTFGQSWPTEPVVPAVAQPPATTQPQASVLPGDQPTVFGLVASTFGGPGNSGFSVDPTGQSMAAPAAVTSQGRRMASNRRLRARAAQPP